MTRLNKVILGATMTMALYSCATFPKTYKNNSPLSTNNLNTLNGQYNFRPQTDQYTDLTYIESDYANERFYRCRKLKGRYCFDTTQIDFVDKYSFRVNILNTEMLEISYFRDTTLFRQLKFKYKLTKDGFLLIKNRNFRLLGLPYVLGAIDIKKRRLSLENGNLVIDEVYHSSGGTLILFGDSKTWTSRDRYLRIK